MKETSPSSSSASNPFAPSTAVTPEKTSCCSCFSCCDDDDVVAGSKEVVVHMNDPAKNAQYNYPDNFIRTSKYTMFTFLPLGLYYQFKKISNCFFLFNMCLCFIPGVAPISPLTAVLPLVFVLGVALVKEGYEDIKRHRADSRANSIPVLVLRNGELTTVKSEALKAGDVIRIDDNDEVRADVLLFSSTNQEGQTFIDTCNLDGETSLKKRRALAATSELDEPESIMSSTLTLRTGQPEPALLSWAGVITLNGKEFAVSLDQFLYRGCCLKNTNSVWGMVVYAGIDTKLFKNLKERPPKSSSLDKKLNYVIFIVGAALVGLLIIFSTLGLVWTIRQSDYWYIEWYLDEYHDGVLWGFRFLSYFILLSYFIPISLFVTIELCKVVQSKWMNADNEMMKFSNGRWTGCHCNTSNLNEQLALVQFIFSDKTGTLTENIMQFKEGDILGTPFSFDNKEEVSALLQPEHPQYSRNLFYFLTLAVCNMVDPFDKDGTRVYEGSSPDEVALVEAAAEAGVTLLKRSSRIITIGFPDGTSKDYTILASLEFTPERKMMSIILEDPETRKITLFNKGADSFVALQLDRGSETQQQLGVAYERLGEMSSTGLRTLLLTTKEITRAEFDAWHAKFEEAGKALNNRETLVDSVCLQMEKDLHLVGCTAIEDKLQDQVPETLSFFLSAGVIVWMLTGDKRETAVTIAATSSICDPRADYIDHVDIGSLNPNTPDAVEKVRCDLEVIENHIALQDAGEEKACTLVIDGPALEIAMTYHFDVFLRVSQRVRSAVCCRLTPIQKANVVHMFQKETGKTALAIGDGANDVSMIQEGRIGVGIRGLEGAQAALSADYAIPSFKHLRRLCAVHGRYSLYRNSSCVMTSLYKNFTLSIVQVIFPFFCGFSAQTFFDGWLLTCFNIILTSIPPFFMGTMDKDIPEEALMERPLLLAECAHQLYFSVRTVAQWAIEAAVHAILIFFVCYSIVEERDHKDRNFTGPMTGTFSFCCLVATVLTRFSLNIRYWQWIQVFGIAISVVLAVLVLLVYSAVPFLVGTNVFYHQLFVIASDGKFYFAILFFIGFVLTVDLTIFFFQSSMFPTIRDRARRQHCLKHNMNSPM